MLATPGDTPPRVSARGFTPWRWRGGRPSSPRAGQARSRRRPRWWGKTKNEISRELFLSVATVKAYVSRLLTKLDLNNRVQVALLVHDADPD